MWSVIDRYGSITLIWIDEKLVIIGRRIGWYVDGTPVIAKIVKVLEMK